MTEWLLVIWNRRHGALLKRGALLALDSFKGYLIPEVKNKTASLNSDLVVIPGGMISRVQVTDVVIKKPFNGHLRKLYSV
jgi:hypothetical protein